jgi:hypothetical protein
MDLMNRRPYQLLALWPGLAGLWMRGHWNSLVIAVGFSLLFNLALASSFLWPDLLGPAFPPIAWPLLAVAWCLSFWVSRKSAHTLDETTGFAVDQDDTLFIQAQNEYLNRNWESCRTILTRQLNSYPRDLESRLLLATACRRLGLIDEALHQLATFRKFDGWQQWSNEIQRELEQIGNQEDHFFDNSGSLAINGQDETPNRTNSPSNAPDAPGVDPINSSDGNPAPAIRLEQSIRGTESLPCEPLPPDSVNDIQPAINNPQPQKRAA